MLESIPSIKKRLLDALPIDMQSSIRKRRKEVDYLRYLTWKARLRLKDATLKKPIFMIGCPRSGTTLAVKLFDKHSDVTDWSEAGHIWDPYNYYDAEADHQWGVDKITEKDRKRLHSVFEHYRQINGKERFINKHPRNSIRLDYIEAIFPDAYYIHVIRDGRAVVNSIIDNIEKRPERQGFPYGNFCKPPNWREYLNEDIVTQSAHQWDEIVKYILDRKDSLGNRYIEIKYEDLCVNTRDTYKALYDFVGMSTAADELQKIPEQLSSMNYKFLEKFTPEQLKTIVSIQGDLLKKLGYID